MRLGVPLHTHEYELACTLIDREPLTATDLARVSRLSNTGFFNVLNDMVAKEALHAEVNASDQRSKLYRLDTDVKDRILKQFEFYRASRVAAFRSLGIENPELSIQSRHKIHKLPIRHLTCEFQILLYLFLKPGISNSEFVEIVGASETKFNTTLRELTGKGLVYFERDPGDRRRKLYHITEPVRAIILDLHERTFGWLEARHATRAAA